MSFMNSWTKKLGLGGLRLISFLAHGTPWWLRKIFASFMTFLWWDVLGVRKTIVYRNLCIAFPLMSRSERLEIARQSLWHLILDLFEVLRIPMMDQAWLNKNIEFHGEQNLRAALDKNKGVLALSLHVGSGDLAITSVTMRGYPLHVITKRFRSVLADKIWFYFRGAQGARFMEAHGSRTAHEILSLLKKNQMVTFVMDQYMGPPYGLLTKFFGRSTGTAYGLALFAIRTQAPIVPIYIYRDGKGKNHIIMEPEISWTFGTKDRDAQVLELTQKLNDHLERIVRSYPKNWMWVHRRWKEFG